MQRHGAKRSSRDVQLIAIGGRVEMMRKVDLDC
jgi:hypothetical protein